MDSTSFKPYKYDPDLFYGNDTETYASAARWLMWENNQLIPPMHDLVMHLIRLPEEQRDPRVLRQIQASTRFFAAHLKVAEVIVIPVRDHVQIRILEVRHHLS